MIELMKGMHAVKSLYLSSDSQSKSKVKQIERENEKIEVNEERGESSSIVHIVIHSSSGALEQ